MFRLQLRILPIYKYVDQLQLEFTHNFMNFLREGTHRILNCKLEDQRQWTGRQQQQHRNNSFLATSPILMEPKPPSKCLGGIGSLGNVLLEQRPDSKPHAEIRASRLIVLQKYSEQ